MTPTAPRTFAREAEAFRTYCQRQFEEPLEYNFNAVPILDGILTECYESLQRMKNAEAWTYLNNMCLAAGAFLGEILVRNLGGEWRFYGDPAKLESWTVFVTPRAGKPQRVPVFGAVYQFLHEGPNETLLATVAPFLGPDGKWPNEPLATPKPPRRNSSPKAGRMARGPKKMNRRR